MTVELWRRPYNLKPIVPWGSVLLTAKGATLAVRATRAVDVFQSQHPRLLLVCACIPLASILRWGSSYLGALFCVLAVVRRRVDGLVSFCWARVYS